MAASHRMAASIRRYLAYVTNALTMSTAYETLHKHM
jgi:hypothetical protein